VLDYGLDFFEIVVLGSGGGVRYARNQKLGDFGGFVK
jgi:hypothetical protein